MTFNIEESRRYLEVRFQHERAEREARRLAALDALRAAIRQAGPRFPSVRRIYLFGSVLLPGDFRFDSDIDIGVEGQLEAADYWGLWRELDEQAPGWETELVELDRARVHFAKRVRETGELVYEAGNPDSEGGSAG